MACGLAIQRVARKMAFDVPQKFKHGHRMSAFSAVASAGMVPAMSSANNTQPSLGGGND